MPTPSARFFRDPAAFRAWLEKNHGTAKELLLGFHKAHVAKAKDGLSRKDAIDEALCFGWIDGRVTGDGDERYTIRFSPRTKGSIWSAVNLKRIEELIAMGRVTPAGLATYRNRDPKKQKIYSFENAPRSLTAAHERAFRAKKKAWAFWESTPPSYRRVVCHWIASAKKEETKDKRMAEVIACSTNEELIPLIAKWKKKRVTAKAGKSRPR